MRLKNAFIFFQIAGMMIGLSGCAATFKHVAKDPNDMVWSISVETTRKKTFPASNWLAKVGEDEGWNSSNNNNMGLGQLLVLPFYPLTFIIDMASFAHKDIYRFGFDFNGVIPTTDGAPYANKKILVSGPVTGEIETDSSGQFDKRLWATSSSPKTYLDPPLQFVFSQMPSLADGTSVTVMVPLGVEMMLC